MTKKRKEKLVEALPRLPPARQVALWLFFNTPRGNDNVLVLFRRLRGESMTWFRQKGSDVYMSWTFVPTRRTKKEEAQAAELNCLCFTLPQARPSLVLSICFVFISQVLIHEQPPPIAVICHGGGSCGSSSSSSSLWAHIKSTQRDWRPAGDRKIVNPVFFFNLFVFPPKILNYFLPQERLNILFLKPELKPGPVYMHTKQAPWVDNLLPLSFSKLVSVVEKHFYATKPTAILLQSIGLAAL